MTSQIYKHFDAVKIVREKDEATLVLGWEGNHRIRRYINLYTIDTVIFGQCNTYSSNTEITKLFREVKNGNV